MNKNLHTAINDVYQEVGYVQKDGKINFGNTKYNFAGEAAFIRAIRPAMIKHGLAIAPTAFNVLSMQKFGKDDKNFLCTISAEYHLLHTSGESMTISTLGQGADSGDKAIPKALTGAYKYALRQLFMIETGDDPDNTASDIYGLVDNISNYLDKCDSIGEFNKKSQAVREAIDTLKIASYRDYAALNKQFNTLKKKLDSNPEEKQQQKPKNTTAKNDDLERLFERISSYDNLEDGIKYLHSEPLQEWLLKIDKKERYQVLKYVANKVNVTVKSNPVIEQLDLITACQTMCVYGVDLDFIGAELTPSIELLKIKESYEREAKNMAGCLPFEK